MFINLNVAPPARPYVAHRFFLWRLIVLAISTPPPYNIPIPTFARAHVHHIQSNNHHIQSNNCQKMKIKKTNPKIAKRKKFYGKRFSKFAIKKVQDAGLPPPNIYSKSEIINLQNTWYDKLAKDGFSDIEWVDKKTGHGHDTPYLKGSGGGGKLYHPGRALYFDMAVNYLNHCKSLRGFERFVWKLHSTNTTYDSMVKQLNLRYNNVPSKYTIFYLVQKLAKKCYKWNCTHPEGLLVKRVEDRARITESIVAEIVETTYNWIIGEEPL